MEKGVVSITPQNQRKQRGGLCLYLVGVSTARGGLMITVAERGGTGLGTGATAQKALDW